MYTKFNVRVLSHIFFSSSGPIFFRSAEFNLSFFFFYTHNRVTEISSNFVLLVCSLWAPRTALHCILFLSLSMAFTVLFQEHENVEISPPWKNTLAVVEAKFVPCHCFLCFSTGIMRNLHLVLWQASSCSKKQQEKHWWLIRHITCDTICTQQKWLKWSTIWRVVFLPKLIQLQKHGSYRGC